MALYESLSGADIAIFGEVLFDCFPNEEPVLGGAPLNVAWSLRGFGLTPHFISAIGQDDFGVRVKQTLRDWDISLDFVHVSNNLPTGKVTVELQDGTPQYDIVPHQAYDAIPVDSEEILRAISPPRILYHGSLAVRDERSKQSLAAIKDTRAFEVFVDVNLRKPWWSKNALLPLLQKARWIKLNDEELELILEQTFDRKNEESLLKGCEEMSRRFACPNILLTRGSAGACFLLEDGSQFSISAPPPRTLRDTVGAGDAFSAMWLYGVITGRNPKELAQAALVFASMICEQRGATVQDRTFYEEAAREL